MARFETVHIFIFIVFFVLNVVVYLVECDDKRIIIYVPRRVKTVHHHHHHVVLMDPKSKTVTHAKPYSEKSSAAEGFHHHHHQVQQQKQQFTQQQQQQHHQQQSLVRTGSGTGGPNVNVLAVYPAGQLPVVQVPVAAYTSWPARKKRSKVVARLFTY